VRDIVTPHEEKGKERTSLYSNVPSIEAPGGSPTVSDPVPQSSISG
jgi:hypothetical protein